MPSVTRKRVLRASPEQVFDLISDPRSLTEWWPRVVRVEHVTGKPGAARTRWTNVLAADSGRKLRLDYCCLASNRPDRYQWEHELEGTPFADHLLSQVNEIRLAPHPEGTEARLSSTHTLRGSARLAGFAMKRSQKEMLERALTGLERVFGEDGRPRLEKNIEEDG
ncbi:MAG: SRPBCC family protein [Solirubrobacterales bacterium]